MPIKYTEQQYNDLAQKFGYIFIGPIPQSSHHNTWWICPNNHKTWKSYNNLNHRAICRICSNTNIPKTEEDYHKIAKEKNIKYIGPMQNSVMKKTQWKCKCGNVFLRTFNHVKCGKINCYLCGREITKKFKSNGYEEITGSLWTRINKGAIERGFECSISIEQAWDKFIQQDRKCALSGVLLLFYKLRKECSKTTASLDRIDSRKGYIPDNIQWVHKDVNRMKQAFQEDEFLNWCQLIVNNKKI